MSITTVTILESFLAILTNIVGGFGMGVSHMASHVMFKISTLATE